MRSGQLADVGSGNGHFTADTNTLHEAAREQGRKVSRDRAPKAHHGHDSNRGRHTVNTPKPLGEPTEHQCSKKLSDVTRCDKDANLLWRNVPQPNEDWQHKRE